MWKLNFDQLPINRISSYRPNILLFYFFGTVFLPKPVFLCVIIMGAIICEYVCGEGGGFMLFG